MHERLIGVSDVARSVISESMPPIDVPILVGLGGTAAIVVGMAGFHWGEKLRSFRRRDGQDRVNKKE